MIINLSKFHFMKYLLCILLSMICLGLCSCDEKPEQTKNIKTTKKKAKITKIKESPVEKTHHTETDGFSWYLLKRDSLYGALNEKGDTIIPIKYDSVEYYNKYFYHYFCVKQNGFVGTYSRSGYIIIYPESKYNEVELLGFGDSFLYWKAKKNNSSAFELLDSHGKIVIPFSAQFIDFYFEVDNDPPYIIACKKEEQEDDGNVYYLLDINGRLLHDSPKYTWDVGLNSAVGYDGGEDGAEETIYYDELTSSSQFNYDNFDLLYEETPGCTFDEDGYLVKKDSQEDDYTTDDIEPEPEADPGLLYSGMYTISAQGRSLSTGAYTDAIGGDLPVEIKIYEDRIIINNIDELPHTGDSGSTRIYRGVPQFSTGGEDTYYVTENYNIRKVSEFYGPYGVDYFEHQVAKGETTMSRYSNSYSSDMQSTSSGSYSSGASERSNKRTSSHDCTYCNGTGKRLHESYDVPTYGQPYEQQRCKECGATYSNGTVHAHVTCGHCGGTGIMR